MQRLRKHKQYQSYFHYQLVRSPIWRETANVSSHFKYSYKIGLLVIYMNQMKWPWFFCSFIQRLITLQQKQTRVIFNTTCQNMYVMRKTETIDHMKLWMLYTHTNNINSNSTLICRFNRISIQTTIVCLFLIWFIDYFVAMSL